MKRVLHGLLKHFNVVLLLLFILIASLTTRNFFTSRNIFNILQQSTVPGLLALGMTFVILCGHMDLSVGAILTLTGLMCISLQQYVPVGIAIVLALLAGMMIGGFNGAVVVLTRANSGESLMMTFGTQLLLAGISLLYTRGFALDASTSDFFNAIGIGRVGGIPIAVLLFLGIILLFGFLEQGTVFGRQLHMIGYNAEASRLSGLQLGKVKILCYAISGLLAAAGAIILSSRTLGATPTAGEGYEMDAIIAVVLGGTSLAGGVGSVTNTVVGVLTLGVLGNTMNLMGFQIFDQMIVKGGMLILCVLTDVMGRRQAALK